MEGKLKYIPPDIVFKFLLRLPVKSLLESRRVCKLWNEMIRSKPFIKSHVDHQKTTSSSSDATVNRYLLTDYRGSFTAGLVQGESYELLESSAYKLFDTFGETFFDIKARGICDGLLCLSCNDTYFLLNPVLKIVFQVPPRDIQFDDVKGWQACSVCFGYHDDDYKVIEIHNAWPMYYLCIYSLNTNSWSLREFACPLNEFIGSDGEFVDGGSLIVNSVVYFVRHTERGVLVWFDLIRGTVTEMWLPENFKLTTKYIMEEYRGSIALIEYTLNDDRQSDNDLSMWVLKLSDTDASVVCHTKKFEAGTNYRCDPIGLIDNNKVVMMITDKTVRMYSRKYFLYDVETEYQHRFMAFEGKLEEHKEGPCPSRVNNFVESLVLLTIPTPYVLRKKGSYSVMTLRDQHEVVD